MSKPKLRFSEFTNEWVKHTLSEFTERMTRKNKNEETDIPLTISSLDGLVDQREYFNKTVASKDMSEYYLLKKGEFAYNKSYSVGFDYGSIKRLDRYEQGALSTPYICFSLTDNDTVDSDYIVQYFDSLKWNSEAALICAEGARNHGLLNVSPNDFFKMAVIVPASLKEQNKIAEFLQVLDNVISKTQSEITAWEKQKRGVMQLLFSRKVRFKADDGSEFPEWESKRMSDVGMQLTLSIDSRAYPNDVFFEYSMPAFDAGKAAVEVYGFEMNSTRKLLPEPCVLINKLNVRKKKNMGSRTAGGKCSMFI